MMKQMLNIMLMLVFLCAAHGAVGEAIAAQFRRVVRVHLPTVALSRVGKVNLCPPYLATWLIYSVNKFKVVSQNSIHKFANIRKLDFAPFAVYTMFNEKMKLLFYEMEGTHRWLI